MSYQNAGTSYQNPNAESSSIEILTTKEPVQPVNATGEQNIRVNRYETELPIRIDLEAALTYVLGCVTGIFFLIFETKNDYVRFHAWQSTILYTAFLIINFFLINTAIVKLLTLIEILLICFLAYKAYTCADSLLRFELPIVGRIASDWVDAE